MTATPGYQAYPSPAPAPASTPLPVLLSVADAAPQSRLTVAFRLILIVPHAIILGALNYAAGFVAFLAWWGALFTGRLPQFAESLLAGYVRWLGRVMAYELLLTSAYPPFALGDDPAYPVRIAVPPPQRLNRAAVFFRLILAFPATILTLAVTWGCSLVGIVAWLITLVTGRLPDSFHLAFSAAVRYCTRFQSYVLMLTPAYPKGLFGDTDTAPTWADALPTAPEPPGYAAPGPQGGYGTPSGYDTPAGYGNPSGYGPPAGYGPPTGYGAPSGYDTPAGYGNPSGYGAPTGYGPPSGYDTPAGYGNPSGYGPPAGYGTPGGYGAQPVRQPANWLLKLTTAAQWVVATYLVLGLLAWAGYMTVDIMFTARQVNQIQQAQLATNASLQVSEAHATLTANLNKWERATAACDQNLTCVTRQDKSAAGYFSDFTATLVNTELPNGTTAAEERLYQDSSRAEQAFTALSKTTTPMQYQSTFDSAKLQQTLDDFDADYASFMNKL